MYILGTFWIKYRRFLYHCVIAKPHFAGSIAVAIDAGYKRGWYIPDDDNGNDGGDDDYDNDDDGDVSDNHDHDGHYSCLN